MQATYIRAPVAGTLGQLLAERWSGHEGWHSNAALEYTPFLAPGKVILDLKILYD